MVCLKAHPDIVYPYEEYCKNHNSHDGYGGIVNSDAVVGIET